MAQVVRLLSPITNNAEQVMIIAINDYRRANSECAVEPLDERLLFGNTVRVPRVRTRHYEAQHLSSPQLPDDFDDFNAKDFIERAYALATQI